MHPSRAPKHLESTAEEMSGGGETAKLEVVKTREKFDEEKAVTVARRTHAAR
jgi:hypothetical protein